MTATRAEAAAGLGLLLVVVASLGFRLGLPPYDDAWFFLRFARNLWDHGVFAWNPGDGPVHGNTSQLFQVLVAALHPLGGGYTTLLIRGFAGLCLLGTGVVLTRRSETWVPAVLALCSPVALATLVSGMETSLVLLLGAVFVVHARRAHGAGWLAAVLVLLCYLARPDTLLLTVPTLLASRPLPWRSLVAAGLGLAALLGGLHLAYGSALPLSFYLKSTANPLYDPHFLAQSQAAKLRHGALFALVAIPFLAVALHDLRRSARWLVPAGLFVGYHALIAVDVMGLHGRFYAPALPWLVVAAAAAWPGFRARGRWWTWAGLGLGLGGLAASGVLPGDSGWVIGRISPWILAGAVLASMIALVPAGGSLHGRAAAVTATTLVCLSLAHGRVPDRLPNDAAFVDAGRRMATSWRGAVQLRRCLGADVHLFHSEIGVVGMMFPDGRVTDLGGLMNAPATLEGVGFEALCQQAQPDAIFLPHRNYRFLNQQIAEGACIQGYVRVVEKGSSPLYVRGDRLAAYRCGD